MGGGDYGMDEVCCAMACDDYEEEEV